MSVIRRAFTDLSWWMTLILMHLSWAVASQVGRKIRLPQLHSALHGERLQTCCRNQVSKTQLTELLYFTLARLTLKFPVWCSFDLGWTWLADIIFSKLLCAARIYGHSSAFFYQWIFTVKSHAFLFTSQMGIQMKALRKAYSGLFYF